MSMARERSRAPVISAIDLFCGAGGLSAGLREAGVSVVAGVDVDAACRHPFEENIKATFVEQDVREVSGDQLRNLWAHDSVTMLAGCAPCQPFSPYRRGKDTTAEEQWPLLNEFGRLVREATPDLVTMENVPRIGSTSVFERFVDELVSLGYTVDWESCYGPDYGLPQHRRRLVLMASRFGSITVPAGTFDLADHPTVREAIGDLRALAAGETDEADPLHKARSLSELNIKRIRASRQGGSWQDWPPSLRSACHRKASGASFRNVYARMAWDEPAPTITTLAYNFGAGRFGHPEQDRPISLREAAILQGFSGDYSFVPGEGAAISFLHLGRLIGNAVPPPMARAIGMAFVNHVSVLASPPRARAA
jgi:DNA (cytosine-5)-methyltransferase 1